MNRAERRRLEKKAAKKVPTYNLTRPMINSAVMAEMNGIIEEAKSEVLNQMMTLMFALPIMVLKKHYWKKGDARRMREFTQRVLEIYEAYENGEITLDDIRKELWDTVGIRLEESE